MPSQVAIVTGAADGIGKAIALRLASDGYDIVVADLPHQRPRMDVVVDLVTKTTERNAISCEVDVTQEDQVKALIKVAVERLGGLDVMIANAGIAPMTPLIAISLSEWKTVLDVNATGAFLCYREAAKSMIDRGIKGRIVGACSIAGKKGEAFIGAYSASKFALRGMTQVAACEWAQHGIRVNCYAPGPIDTPMLEKAGERAIELFNITPGEFREQGKRRTVFNRLGRPEEIADAVSFLVSDKASFITGQTINVDGGAIFD